MPMLPNLSPVQCSLANLLHNVEPPEPVLKAMGELCGSLEPEVTMVMRALGDKLQLTPELLLPIHECVATIPLPPVRRPLVFRTGLGQSLSI